MRRRVIANEPVDLVEFDFSVRVLNCFKNAEIFTLHELLLKQPCELLELLNFGPTCLLEVEVMLADFGVRLAGGSRELPIDSLPERFKFTLEEADARVETLRASKSGRAERMSLDRYIQILEYQEKKEFSRQLEQSSLNEMRSWAAGDPVLEKIIATGGFTQREIVVLRERGSKTLKQIRDILGVKGIEQVRQAEGKAYRRLRHPSRKHLAPEIHALGLCNRVNIRCEICGTSPFY